MNIPYKNRHFQFQDSKKNTVFINFYTVLYDSPRGELTQRVTYCTISVFCEDGRVDHYHGATVYNPHDNNYNQRTGMFVAYKKAMRNRWFDIVGDDARPDFDDYYRAWSHFLAAMMDGKVTNVSDYISNL